ncbi:MAG TPA: rhodanese-like domain-containing protein [candidate division Zixibacteria bacterium]|nr:rhodanese-like domain-containing protein [candidate division Zixibacteria bacterium]
MIRQAIVLLFFSIVLGLGVNVFHPHKIPFIGEYRELSSGEGPIIPPSASEGDPPFIAIDVAQMEHQMGGTMFVDARDSLEFNCGTIPGSINIPFDYLPAENLAAYIDSSLGRVPKDKPMIVFCSGEECDLSLHLARNFKGFGYTQVSIFFGGAREWEKFELEMERRAKCGE